MSSSGCVPKNSRKPYGYKDCFTIKLYLITFPARFFNTFHPYFCLCLWVMCAVVTSKLPYIMTTEISVNCSGLWIEPLGVNGLNPNKIISESQPGNFWILRGLPLRTWCKMVGRLVTSIGHQWHFWWHDPADELSPTKVQLIIYEKVCYGTLLEDLLWETGKCEKDLRLNQHNSNWCGAASRWAIHQRHHPRVGTGRKYLGRGHQGSQSWRALRIQTSMLST